MQTVTGKSGAKQGTVGVTVAGSARSDLVDIRSAATAIWVRSLQEATAVLHERPATGTP